MVVAEKAKAIPPASHPPTGTAGKLQFPDIRKIVDQPPGVSVTLPDRRFFKNSIDILLRPNPPKTLPQAEKPLFSWGYASFLRKAMKTGGYEATLISSMKTGGYRPNFRKPMFSVVYGPAFRNPLFSVAYRPKLRSCLNPRGYGPALRNRLKSIGSEAFWAKGWKTV